MENEKPLETGTATEEQPGTGDQTKTAANQLPVKPEAGSDTSSDLADKLSMWQAMSRENERKMHANMKRATEAEGKLAEVQHQYADAQAEIAKLKAQAAYPQLTDEVFAKIAPKGADAAAIEEWAKDAAQFIHPAQDADTATANGAAEPERESPAAIDARLTSALHSTGSTKGSVESAYDYGRKFASIGNDK